MLEQSTFPEPAPEPSQDALNLGENGVALTEEQIIADNYIPVGFWGVWDNVNVTCVRESDLRLEIQADALYFYESYGEVTGVEGEADDILVSLAMVSEGESWDQTIRLSLVGDAIDERLSLSIRSSADGSSTKNADEIVRKRCYN